MSRMATNEYIGTKRRAYAQANRAKRCSILDDVCETTGYERKYANRLLTGSRKFREHKGRGKTYGDDVADVLKKVWREAGCPCLPYFKAETRTGSDPFGGVGSGGVAEICSARPRGGLHFCRNFAMFCEDISPSSPPLPPRPEVAASRSESAPACSRRENEPTQPPFGSRSAETATTSAKSASLRRLHS